MTVGLLTFEIFLPESNSLKAKRMVLHSLKARLRNSFNIALDEVADEDKWQKATLAAAAISRDRRQANSTLSQVVNFLEDFAQINLIDYEIELI